MKKQNQHFEQLLAQFLASYSTGRDALVHSAKTLVQMLDIEPNAFELLIERDSTLDYPILSELERVGRGRLMPELLLAKSAGDQHLATLPCAVQKALYRKFVPVVVRGHNGEFRTTQRRTDKLTWAQMPQVYGRNGINNIEDQTQFLRKKLAENAAKKQRYAEDGDYIQFYGSPRFKKSEIIALAEAFKAKELAGLQKAITANQVRPGYRVHGERVAA